MSSGEFAMDGSWKLELNSNWLLALAVILWWEGGSVGRPMMKGAEAHCAAAASARHGEEAHARSGEEAGAAAVPLSRGSRRLLAALLLLGAAAAVGLVLQGTGGEATELVVPPRLAALRARLQAVEDGMMGMSGADALRAAKQAQSLQLVINNEQAVALRAQAARAPGPATLQTLTAFKARAPAIRAAKAARAHGEPEISYASAVAAGAARGPVPLDTTWKSRKQGLSAAQRLAANLARYRKGAVRQPQTKTVQGSTVPIEAAAHGPSNVNPWSVVPKNPIVKRPAHKAAAPHSVRGAMPAKVTRKQGKAMLVEGRRILARSYTHPPKGARRLLPGQKLPKGAKLLVKGKNGVYHTQALTRVMLDDADGADAEGADAEGGNSTEVREEVGDTGMTVEELEQFAVSEKAKAKYLLGEGESERDAAMQSLDDSRNTIDRGWQKHEAADATVAEAEQHMAESTNLFSTYQREVALAKAEQEGKLADRMTEIADTFAEDAAAKHSNYEEQLGGAGDLDLTPYVRPTNNSTNTTSGAEGEEEEVVV